ncbi:hypothetical protein KY345_02625 [Candidatus Woesearchaeota archaeon]|nr:hypothetical protein [Candidatus Woesearchaeota archaeon]
MIERRIGFHIKSMDELMRIGSIEGVNLVELKPGKMKKRGDILYTFDGTKFSIDEELAKEISDFCRTRDIQMQVHLPYETKADSSLEEGLCYGIKAHHPKLLDRFKMMADLYNKYGIGKVLVFHPPQLVVKGQRICSYHDGIEHGREFLYMLDEERKSNKWHENIAVGLENMIPPKEESAALGYTPDQLRDLLGWTETIGYTVDSGHRRLSDEMSVAKMFARAPVVALHFHSNPGVFHKKGEHKGHDGDDAHEFARRKNLEHFNSYIRGIRRFKLPVTCEIANLNEIPDNVIKDYVAELRFMLD